ncbi:MAG: SPOR domain-containing protein [Bacteroidales bacterium]|nr:SPOR domain-containing protein [Bacteroidales bacterium]
MNITDLIVEFIQQGNVVEFPGMGTLSSSNVSAHHDAATGTYHPARRTVTMVETLTGNKAIVRRIAEKECVTNEIAEQMWINYIAALKDKLQRNANGHEFPGIGSMRYVGSKVRFDAIEGLDLDAGKKHEQPLENIATYTPKAVADPFAAFDKPATAAAPAPVVKEEPVPAPVVEKPVETPAPQPKPEPVKMEAPKVEEPKAEPVKAEMPKAEPVKVETPKSAAPQVDHLSEVKRMLDEIPSSPKDAKEARRAEKAAAKAEKEARKAAEEARKAAEEAERNAAKAKEKEAQKAAKEMAKSERAMLKAEEPKKQKKEQKKKKHGWLWVVIILLLLLLGAAAWWFFGKGHAPAAKGVSYAQEVELVYPEPFTAEDYPLLVFQEQDILYNVGHLHNYMEDYVHTFLAAHHFTNAFAAMMAKVDEYADGRLHELMVEGYSPKRFFPHNNFWLKSHYVAYKSEAARYYRYKVQGELMDLDLLDDMLNDVVMTLGLRADGFRQGRGGDGGAVAGAGRAQAAKPVSDKPYEEVVPEAPTFKNSKQGFDIVAGFFTSKKSANKCANQLKALGSDAYIISKSGGYYVSMGSAPTRTAAESMEKHIKSWYKSDVKIYNFNE